VPFFLLLFSLAASAPGVELVHSYPELRVNGKPFFVHSAAFFYYRVPRERWEPFLRRYRALGINTLDLYVPWNWHEPAEGQRDFHGKSDPRRDIVGLLRLAGRLGFQVILRPGPVILNEWRNGGYPDWLLKRPEYGMPLIDVLEGRYAPMSNLGPRNSEDASRGWMENPVHMTYARDWMRGVARELVAPFKQSILAVQLDDDQALGRSNYNGPQFWRYMQALREWLAEGGNDRPVFINPTDMRVSAAGFDPAFPAPVAAMGQWYQPAARPGQPVNAAGTERPAEAGAAAGMPLQLSDYTDLEFSTEVLKTQPRFPPMIIEYQAGWYCPADDTSPRLSHPANTMLAAREMMAAGLKGINYFPLQDYVYPAGYEVPWANRHYFWGAALDVDGAEQAKAAAVRRNGRLIEGIGALLAATHKWADAGIIYPLGAYPQEKLTPADIRRISGRVIEWQQELRRKSVSTELVDPEYQPPDQLRRYPVLLLREDENFQMSERAKRVIRESGVPVMGEMPVGERVVDAPPEIRAAVLRSNAAPHYGFLFVTNPSYDTDREVRITVRDPRDPSKRLELPPFTVARHDSVALPLRVRVAECGMRNAQEIVWATAELTGCRNGRAEFYAPREAQVRLVRRGREETVAVPASAIPHSVFRTPPIPSARPTDAEEVLDNGRLRVVFTPDAGGRAFRIERAGRNATTTVGFFRDRFSRYEQPPGINPRRLRGMYGLHNRPYTVQKRGDTVTLEYAAPDVPPSGVRIRKTFTLPAGRDYLLVDYEFEGLSEGQNFVSMNSVPWLGSESGPGWLAGRAGGDLFMLFWEQAGQGVAAPQSFSSLWNVTFPGPRVRMALWYGPGATPAVAEELKRVLGSMHP
jgi:hypothetical protein